MAHTQTDASQRTELASYQEAHSYASDTKIAEGSDMAIGEIPSSGTENEEQPRLFLWYIKLQPYVHPVRFFVYLLSVFTVLAVVVFVANAQSWIVLSILGYPQEESGDIVGSLSTYSEVMSVIAVVVWGTTSDKLQKRTVAAVSLAIMGVCTIGMPFVKNVYPDLLMARLMYSIGTAGATSMMAAMMMETAFGVGGMVSGLIGICSGLGASFGALVLFVMPAKISHLLDRINGEIYLGMGIVGAVTTVLAGLYWIFTPVVPQNRKLHVLFPERRQNFLTRLKIGFMAASDPRIAVGFLSSFFARADEVIITHFVSLWVTVYYIERGDCVVGRTCHLASATASTMTGYAQLIGLAITPFFALGSEYLPKEVAVMFAGVIGAAGCFPFAFSIDPTSKACLAFVILIAFGQYGMIISGMAMINIDTVKPEHRGSVAGAYSFCGAIGIIVVSKIGGVLFDKYMKGAPFLILGIGHALCTVCAFAVLLYRTIKYLRQRSALKKEQICQ